MKSNGKMIDLDALLQPAGQVRLFGEAREVMPLDGAAFHAIQSMTAAKAVDVEAMYRIAGRCVPSLSEAQTLELSLPQVEKIIEIASGQIEAVERAFPNRKRPATTKAVSPA